MRAPLLLCALLSTAACDQVFTLDRLDAPVIADAAADAIDAPPVDLDMDGMPDESDLCLAHPGEGDAYDLDLDGIFDAVDNCPYDGPNGTDGDGDGIEDNCDPSPSAANRVRCLMLFSRSELNTAMWPVRSPDHAWSNDSGALIADPPITGHTLATTIVSPSIEGTNISSYDVALRVTPRGQDGSITMWLRADPDEPSPDDIGCRYVTEPSGSRLAVVRGSTLLGAQPALGLPVGPLYGRMRARIVVTGAIGAPASVSCSIGLGGMSAAATAAPPLSAGRFGFTVDRWLVHARALQIIDQP